MGTPARAAHVVTSVGMASIAALALGATVAAPAAANPDKLAYGKHLSQECTTCHRMDGRGTNIPPLAGLQPDYFVTTMKFYKTGARDNPAMKSVAEMLNDEQLDALATYFATLKAPAKQAPAKKK